MSVADEARQIIADLQSALVQATGQIASLGMRVTELGVDLKTVFVKGASGEIDLKLVKLGGGGSFEESSSISLTIEPVDVVSAQAIDDEVSRALEIIEAAVATIDEDFGLTSAKVEIAFVATVEGKIGVVLGGEVSREHAHTVSVTFAPVR